LVVQVQQLEYQLGSKSYELSVSDKSDLGSFVPEFFNFDQIKVRTKL